MEQSPFWESNSSSTSQQIPRILWNPKFHCQKEKPFMTPTKYRILINNFKWASATWFGTGVSSSKWLTLNEQNLLTTSHFVRPQDGALVPKRVGDVPLTLILLTWRIWWVPNKASKQLMGFNSAFKGLIFVLINPLAPELFFFLILAHPVYKMWIIQEPNRLALWNKLHFDEKKTESVEHV